MRQSFLRKVNIPNHPFKLSPSLLSAYFFRGVKRFVPLWATDVVTATVIEWFFSAKFFFHFYRFRKCAINQTPSFLFLSSATPRLERHERLARSRLLEGVGTAGVQNGAEEVETHDCLNKRRQLYNPKVLNYIRNYGDFKTLSQEICSSMERIPIQREKLRVRRIF